MAEVKVRQLKQALERKGFRLTNSNHQFYLFYYKGKKTRIKTKISHGKDVISDPLIRCMRTQMKLEKMEFLDFVKCHLSESDYIEILLQQKILT